MKGRLERIEAIFFTDTFRFLLLIFKKFKEEYKKRLCQTHGNILKFIIIIFEHFRPVVSEKSVFTWVKLIFFRKPLNRIFRNIFQHKL